MKEMKRPITYICTDNIICENYLNGLVNALNLEGKVLINKNCQNKGCNCTGEKMLDNLQKCKQKWLSPNVYMVHDYGHSERTGQGVFSYFKTIPRAHTESDIIVIMNIPCIEYWLLSHLENPTYNLDIRKTRDKLCELLNKRRKNKGKAPLTYGDYKSNEDLFDILGGLPAVKFALNNSKEKYEAIQKYVQNYDYQWEIFASAEEEQKSTENDGFDTACVGFIEILKRQMPFSTMPTLINRLMDISTINDTR